MVLIVVTIIYPISQVVMLRRTATMSSFNGESQLLSGLSTTSTKKMMNLITEIRSSFDTSQAQARELKQLALRKATQIHRYPLSRNQIPQAAPVKPSLIVRIYNRALWHWRGGKHSEAATPKPATRRRRDTTVLRKNQPSVTPVRKKPSTPFLPVSAFTRRPKRSKTTPTGSPTNQYHFHDAPAADGIVIAFVGIDWNKTAVDGKSSWHRFVAPLRAGGFTVPVGQSH